MVVFPVTFEQPGAAVRVQYHRLWVVGNLKKATVSEVAGLIGKVPGESSFKTSMATMSAIFQKAEHDQLAVCLIEKLQR